MKYFNDDICGRTIKIVVFYSLCVVFGASLAKCVNHDPYAQFEEVTPVTPTWSNIPGLSPDYLRDEHNVVVFQCGRYSPALLIDRVTDGTNSLHLYRSPCWVL